MSSSLSALKCVLVCFAVAFFVLAGAAHAQQTATCPHTPANPPTDRDALITLYCATDGDNWGSGRNTNWLTDQSLNNWYKVTADDAGTPNDNSDDIVTELRLDNRTYLHGEIPPEIGNLTSLTRLEISYNRHGLLERYLTGSIPPELGNLANLTELILDNNTRLTGSIPPELGNLTNLTKLEIHNCDLTGSIPPELGNLGNPGPSDPSSSSSLDFFDLSENSLSGPLPPELGNLDGVTSIYLHDNSLSGPLPPELGEMSSLGRLIIFNNQLTGPLPVELFSMGKLHTLDLRNNRIDGEIPAAPGDFMFLDPGDNTMKSQQLSHLYL